MSSCDNDQSQMEQADVQSLQSMTSKPSSPAQSNRPTPKHEFEGHQDTIYSFVFLHDNIHIVSGSGDGTIRKWDCETGHLVGEPWEGQSKSLVWALALSPDGNTIACGRKDGSVEMWSTDGEMIQGIWTGHSAIVRSLSWSPSGSHIASGSQDGTILIRKAETGQVEIGPIQTNQKSVESVAYSPLGDRIASGGYNGPICMWDCNTGERLVCPIEDQPEYSVNSVVWSSGDGSKLYSVDQSVRVLDSIEGTELHRFEPGKFSYSIALSPKHHLLACVGEKGAAQLWDTESYQPLALGQPFHQENHQDLLHVSFSQDGRYLAYGGRDKKVTLWMVKDIASDIETPSPSCHQVDVTRPFAQSGDERDNMYDDFFRSPEPSQAFRPSHPSEHPHFLWPRRLLKLFIPSQHQMPASASVRLLRRPLRTFFARHTGSRPVTVYAGRPKKFYWRAPVVRRDQSVNEENDNTDAQAVSSSAAAELQSTPQVSQHPQSQPTQPEPTQGEYRHSAWANFWLTLGCIPHRPRRIMSSAQPAAS